jgi:hypothetical protein
MRFAFVQTAKLLLRHWRLRHPEGMGNSHTMHGFFVGELTPRSHAKFAGRNEPERHPHLPRQLDDVARVSHRAWWEPEDGAPPSAFRILPGDVSAGGGVLPLVSSGPPVVRAGTAREGASSGGMALLLVASPCREPAPAGNHCSCCGCRSCSCCGSRSGNSWPCCSRNRRAQRDAGSCASPILENVCTIRRHATSFPSRAGAKSDSARIWISAPSMAPRSQARSMAFSFPRSRRRPVRLCRRRSG